MYHHSHPHSAAQPTCTIALDERDGRTHAAVELHWGASHLAGLGVAYRHPADYLASETGQELATARALSDLADQLLLFNGVRN
jgi:hypothetical protein